MPDAREGDDVKILLRILGALVGLLVVVIGVEMIAAESGEVVVLATRDGAGEVHETRLWVVDHEGRSWLRSGSEAAAWYQRLREQPAVEVERGGIQTAFEAVPVVETRQEINRLMLEKYGWADRYISMLFGREDAVPIRLDPR
jgi:hypothetical protein